MDLAFFTAWIQETIRVVSVNRDRLTRLDAAIGDADHGTNLDRGFTSVREALAESPQDNPGQLLTLVGTTLVRRVGGASGPLYGTLFRQLGKSLGDAREVSLGDLATAFATAIDAVRRLGKAAEGDKTMVDALAPASRALADAAREGLRPDDALERAAVAAAEGAKATIPLQARKGRASYLGPRSVGHEDPGAASAALLVSALRP
ncbi:MULTISPECIES: dihydroxyacetone kinase subunit DhaL [unclassified Nonomuraea]|uniref:dihydroxyacetone kinase subunit DhaL n=1 Tax=Nonomuraea sp. NPDC003804 TaxID=3154547 RepID=UPI0033ABAEA2